MPHFCVACGTPYPEASRFCNKCGAGVVTPIDAGAATSNGHRVYQSEFAPFYHAMTIGGVRSLPEEIHIHVLHAWCAENRGECFRARDAEHFQQCFAALYGTLKERVESLLRKRGAEDYEHDFIPLAIWFLLSNKEANLQTVIDQILERLSLEETHFVSPDELKTAVGEFRQDLYAWLDRKGVFYSRKPSITIPVTTATRLLNGFGGHPDVHLAPNIPQDKLANAVAAGGLPASESVSVLIDCTVFGSAADSVLLGSKAVYFNNCGINDYLPYAEFLDRTFLPSHGSEEVSLGKDQRLSLAGSQVKPIHLVQMLDLLKPEVMRLEHAAISGHEEGLSHTPGMASLKQLLLDEVVAPLKNPEKYRKYKIGIPNGVLLYGPPGCGKTFIARRLANELNYNFTEVSPAAIASPYIHDTVLKISNIFQDAAKNAPTLIFVDEFEGIVPDRSSLGGHQQHKAEEVNEWLVQLNSCAERRILFVAATNEPWKIDPAVQRTGRLDKKIYVGPPDGEAIAEILNHHLSGRPVAAAADVAHFARTIEGQGYSASDLKVIADEAAKLAMRADASIGFLHLQQVAAEKVSPSIPRELEEAHQSFVGRGVQHD
jgi:DNA polymerase III delta prime subunit